MTPEHTHAQTTAQQHKRTDEFDDREPDGHDADRRAQKLRAIAEQKRKMRELRKAVRS